MSSRIIWCVVCEDDHEVFATFDGTESAMCPSVGTPRWPGTTYTAAVIWDSSESDRGNAGENSDPETPI